MERACGLDVHKDSVFSCIINENGEIISKKFGVLTPDLEELRRHLVENHVDAAAMESTSIYWMPVWANSPQRKVLLIYYSKDAPTSGRSLGQTHPHIIDYVILDRIKNGFFRGKIVKSS